jgi:hypothetical protein
LGTAIDTFIMPSEALNRDDGSAASQTNPITATGNWTFPAGILYKLFSNLWLFTKEDFFTFVFPNTIFGICTALAGQPFISASAATLPTGYILRRIPLVIAFNFTNLLVFDLSNQRLWESVLEDKLNKPWRPIPAGNMTRSEVRQAMLLAIPGVLAFNHYLLHVGAETACIIVGCWVYNDLKASDAGFIIRNGVIALGFGVFNWSSTKVAIAGGAGNYPQNIAGISSIGYQWIVLYSLVIFTTMHVQDMKDQIGDAARGRRTAPLIFGDGPARWTLAVPIMLWGPICALYCQSGRSVMAVVTGLGVSLAWRCVMLRGRMHDWRTWQLWCAWTAVLGLMPLYR